MTFFIYNTEKQIFLITGTRNNLYYGIISHVRHGDIVYFDNYSVISTHNRVLRVKLC